jgi:hypothetical protein
MIRRTSWMAIAAVAAMALSACGSGFSTGLPKSKQLDDLDDSQARQLCEATLIYYFESFYGGPNAEVICYIEAISWAESRDECREIEMACLEEFEEIWEEIEEDIDWWCDDAEPYECTGTVRQYERCVNDTMGPIDDALRDARRNLSFSCDPDEFEDDIQVLEEIEDRFDDDDEPESCKALNDTCEYAIF